jgi:hypothetical protein
MDTSGVFRRLISAQSALLLNLIWGTLAALFFAANLCQVRKSGLLVKVATQ